MFYLICYDIVDDSRRYKVSKLLETYGLRVQKSVFEAVLDEKQYENIQKRLFKILNSKEDQLRFYPLSDPCRCKVAVLGIKPDFAVDDAAFIV
ncbi:CRISPR-associated endonuclease Cas2 [Argonema antarcticum]|uniref:CRISPR-associated endonuclease Cas2 n=1 Tax=Argonema antarcticum TaxID=2942763 RepID=UPI002011F489|nr:CRISPR-associated endonuclease Cas2 [Argonema antarcticum]MCL1474272.1 CRISPR-associated endonuclease Cas2 [Argonema antarcticum A004/B2]